MNFFTLKSTNNGKNRLPTYVKTEIQHRVNNTDQSDVNCQGTPATEK